MQIDVSPEETIKADMDNMKAGFIAMNDALVEMFNQFVPRDGTPFDYFRTYDTIFREKITLFKGVTVEGDHIGIPYLVKYSAGEALPKVWRLNETDNGS